jgi:hypothetical protein
MLERGRGAGGGPAAGWQRNQPMRPTWAIFFDHGSYVNAPKNHSSFFNFLMYIYCSPGLTTWRLLSQQGMFRTRVIGTGLRPLNRINESINQSINQSPLWSRLCSHCLSTLTSRSSLSVYRSWWVVRSRRIRRSGVSWRVRRGVV